MLERPAFAMLGYGGAHFVPLRSKAFSMQVQDVYPQSEETKTAVQLAIARLSGSPQITPFRRPCIRSLLLEPDMEDLTSIMPSNTDLNELNCPDEEEHEDGVAERESRGSFFSESIFCSTTLSALPLTQAV